MRLRSGSWLREWLVTSARRLCVQGKATNQFEVAYLHTQHYLVSHKGYNQIRPILKTLSWTVVQRALVTLLQAAVTSYTLLLYSVCVAQMFIQQHRIISDQRQK